MQRLGVFARPPEAGKVKTRLSPALPARLACDLYRGLLADALAVAGMAAAERYVYWSDTASTDASDLARGFTAREQRGADLGARLDHAFAELLPDPADRAVVIGADCPELEAREIAAAFALLQSHDVALGPTSDGGYYLIGLRRPAPALFSDIAWGGDQVLNQTLDRAAVLNLSVAMLEPREDVDTPADLVRLIARLAPGGAGAAHTRAALRALGLLPAN